MRNNEAPLPLISANSLREGIIEWIAKKEGVSTNAIDCSKSLVDYGLDSVHLLDLHFYISDMSGSEVDPELLWETPSINALVAAVASVISATRGESAVADRTTSVGT